MTCLCQQGAQGDGNVNTQPVKKRLDLFLIHENLRILKPHSHMVERGKMSRGEGSGEGVDASLLQDTL